MTARSEHRLPARANELADSSTLRPDTFLLTDEGWGWSEGHSSDFASIAKQMIAATTSLSRGYQFTDEGLEWAVANQRDVVSASYLYDCLCANPRQMEPPVEAVRRVLQNPKGNTLLAQTIDEAVRHGDRMPPAQMKRLMRARVEQFLARELRAKRDPFKTERGGGLLRLAIAHGALSALDTMLRRIGPKTLPNPGAFRGQSALTLAAGAGQPQCVELFLPLGDPMGRDGHGQTALRAAAAAGCADSLKLLLPVSDPNAKDNDGRTALMAAVGNEHLACVNLLLPNSDPSIHDRSGHTALTLAVLKGHRECVAALLAHPRASVACSNGETALMLAAGRGDDECVRLLMPFCDPRAVSNNHATALMRAAEAGHAECVKLLLPASDATKQDSPRQRSALMLAAAHAHEECVELLAPHSDVRAHDWRGDTALIFAAKADECGAPRCVELLLPHSDAQATDNEGRNAMWFALHDDNPELADLLAEHSDREQADQALRQFGSADLPRWMAHLAREEAGTLAEAIGLPGGSEPQATAASKPCDPRPAARRL